MSWLSSAKTWLVGIAVAVLAGVGAWLEGRRQGSAAATQQADAEQQAQTETNNAAAAQAEADHAEVRHDVESETAELPDAPAQPVASADPGTAAGQLRDDGWIRD